MTDATTTRLSPEDVNTIYGVASDMQSSVERVIVGKTEIVQLALVALLCEGHILLEDVPGTGKTTLAKAISRSLGCSFRRIQFTPDLMPSDITGIHYFDQKAQEFAFREGPLIAQIVLADEINRATPRTQAALLEAMEERQLTVEGETTLLPRPFLVIATQNPVELEGTFPLPEAQLDRFLLRLNLGYPDEDDEDEILARQEHTNPLDALQPVVTAERLTELSVALQRLHVDPAIRRYAVRIVRETRNEAAFELGASPRASLALFRSARAYAAVQGRDYVLPDDVKSMAPYVLPHRVILSTQTRLRGREVEDLIADVLDRVPVPVEDDPLARSAAPRAASPASSRPEPTAASRPSPSRPASDDDSPWSRR
ncbi:MAG: MoxR family ATPase [Chloroflexi bacterium]|nr:MoxR family ATPase [Chloroflexota bacterium]